ncbi:hypothetical protein TNCV_3916971 [Trichonephila clavipes]|nr:hypothetical protein TNCV_3916971 [Trichonephila clavipes]
MGKTDSLDRSQAFGTFGKFCVVRFWFISVSYKLGEWLKFIKAEKARATPGHAASVKILDDGVHAHGYSDGSVASENNPASPRIETKNTGLNNSDNQNAPQNQLPPPVMLLVEKNYKVQMTAITKEFPKIRSRLTGDFLKLYTDSSEERRQLVQLLKKLRFQFYTIKAKAERPIKVVIKGLPRTTNPEEIKQDLELLGYTPERVNRLIGRKTKTHPPYLFNYSPPKFR